MENQEQHDGIIEFVNQALHKGYYATLGAVGMAQDEFNKLVERGETFANKLVERGESFSEKRQEALDEQVETRQSQVKDLRQKAVDTFDSYTEAALTRAHIPTSKDFEQLNKQVAALGRKIDKLRKEQTKVAA